MTDHAPSPPRAGRLPRAIWTLGWVSLLMDVSSEMIHSLLPVFVVSVLGAGPLMLGIIDGAGEAVALLVKAGSGALSDRMGRRKPLAVAGYGLAALSKPIFAFATGAGAVLAARLIDRCGKGMRGAPRDALIADLVAPPLRGAAYGLRQALDTAGAFLGPVLALLLMWAVDDVRAVFRLAIIPALLATVLLQVGIREPDPAPAAPPPATAGEKAGAPGRTYLWVVFLGGAFTMARFGDAFLVLRVQGGGLDISWTPMVLITMNCVYALAAYPLGRLADRMHRGRLLALGMLPLIGAQLLLAEFDRGLPVWSAVVLWALHLAATQGLLAALVADAVPAGRRGRAFGVFGLVNGVCALAGGLLAGGLWQSMGPAAAFRAGALLSALALGLLLLRPPARSDGP